MQRLSNVIFVLFISNMTLCLAQGDTLIAHCKVRLPESINRIAPVVMPILTSDGQRLYFDRKNYIKNTGGLQDPDEIWVSYRLSNDAWREPENVKELNTTGSDVLFSLSRDEDFALVYNSKLAKGGSGFGISRQTPTGWSTPIGLKIHDYYNNSGYFFGNLSADNRILLFAIERNDTRGGLDLYVSFRQPEDSSWTAPMPLGDDVNTKGDEYSPFLAADGKSLYFASDGHGGLGGFDIFVSRRLDDTWQHWSKPINLGAPINTMGNDHSFALNAAGDTIALISTDAQHLREGIYFVCLPKELRPDKPAVIPITAIQSSKDTLLNFSAYFELGSDNADKYADTLATILQNTDVAHAEFILNGYTCDLGSDKLNNALALRRIYAIEKLLHKKNSHITISAKSFGKQKLHGKTLAGTERYKQRRVDIIIRKKK